MNQYTRKVLRHAWLNHFPLGDASLHIINSQEHFGVSVDACLLFLRTGIVDSPHCATVYPDFSFRNPLNTFGLQGKELVANVEEYLRLKSIDGISYYTWRSGVKHDAARVMELKPDGRHYRNGLNACVDIEDTYLYALMKSSDLANGTTEPSRYVLLTQRSPNDNTDEIERIAPKTWRYLIAHGNVLDARRSIIYRKRPRFAVFGIGAYTFAPWKAAVSGLYKSLRFRVVGPHHGKSVVFDDTCYFVPCQAEHEAEFICMLLNSDICQRFLHSLVFLDSTRPVTTDVLSRVDLMRVAERLGLETEAASMLPDATYYEDAQRVMVYEGRAPYGPWNAATRRNARKSRRYSG